LPIDHAAAATWYNQADSFSWYPLSAVPDTIED
jgi:hypothetical protein